MTKEFPIPGSGEDREDHLLRLAKSLGEGAESLRRARDTYAALKERRAYVQAQIDASGIPRHSPSNAAFSRELDEIDGRIQEMDKGFFDASVDYSLADEEVGAEVKRRSH